MAIINGTAGNEVLTGTTAADTIDGGGGDDTINAGAGNDTVKYYTSYDSTKIKGGLGTDVLNASGIATPLTINLGTEFTDFENIIGGFGTNVLTGTIGANTFTTGDGNDTIDGKGGVDIINTGGGDDIVKYYATYNGTNVKGGLGNDTIDASSFTTAVAINLATQFKDFENILSGAGNDNLVGNDSANVIVSGDGNDTIDGGKGADSIYAGNGNDTIVFRQNATLVDGGAGINVLTAAISTSGVTMDLSNGVLMNIQQVIGSNYNDTVKGTASAEKISAGSGNDSIDGGGGSDTIDAGAGDDYVKYYASYTPANIKGGVGSDTLDVSSLSNLSLNLATQFVDFENIIATVGDDTLIGSAVANSIDGGGGSDSIDAGAGNDSVKYYASYSAAKIKGGLGIDLLDASNLSASVNLSLVQYADFENLNGGSGNDVLTGSSLNNTLSGGAGDDSIDGGAGDDYIDGGSGADTILGGTGNDTIVYDGNDILVDGGAGINTLLVTSGAGNFVFDPAKFLNIQKIVGAGTNDKIAGNADANNIAGGSGDDSIDGGGGNDTIDAGAGNDTVTYYASYVPANIKGGSGTDALDASAINGVVVNLNQYLDFENVIGSANNDTLTGNALNNTIDGGGGDDVIDGGAGNDIVKYYASYNPSKVKGGLGSDTLDASSQSTGIAINLGTQFTDFENITGGTGEDTLTGTSLVNTINSGAGNDVLDGKGGADVINAGDGDDIVKYYTTYTGTNVKGGNGNDTMDASAFSTAVSINLATQFKDFENISGGAGNDNLVGNDLANVIVGGDGNDTIDGGKGADSIYGGTGNDTIVFRSDAVLVDGGAGINILTALPATAGVNVNLTSGVFANIQQVVGSNYNDTIKGTGGADAILSGNGDDIINGGGGADTLDAGAGNDKVTYYSSYNSSSIKGGLGSDTLDAGAETNALSISLTTQFTDFENIIGGAGADTLAGNLLANILQGGAGNDFLDGKAGADKLYGGDGDDILAFNATGTLFDGGAGSDTLTASSATAAVTMDLSKTQFANIETVIGSNYNDIITASSIGTYINGGAGNDQLKGGSGLDTYYFGSGSGKDIILDATGNAGDIVKFGSGITESNLSITKSGNDLVLKTSGTDSLTLKNWYLAGSNKINTFEFTDGTADSITNFSWTSDLNTTPGTFNIRFDYSFDTNHFFDDPTRRQVLEAAADAWETIIKQDFPTVAAGKSLYITNPSTGTGTSWVSDGANVDLTIFVGAHQLGTTTLGLGGPCGWYSNDSRYVGSAFEPEAGSIQFDIDTNWFFDTTPTTSDDIPSAKYDFLAVAEHEMGHILGIGTSPQWHSLTSGSNFIGSNAEAAYGGAVPLNSGLDHFGPNVLSDGTHPLMNPYASPGTRYPITSLDKGALKDLGYNV